MESKSKDIYFNILKKLVDAAYNELLELDDITIYRFGCMMNVDVDLLDDEEYDKFVERCALTCKKLKMAMEKSEKSFNKGMILFE
tara:strand:+ start:136 stop:390 length:255 start_codon:yes stop_codon:yes gene_type:complete